MILIYPLLYYIAFFLAGSVGEKRTSLCLKTAIVFIISSVVIAALLVAILRREQMGGLILVAMLLTICFPPLIWGLGACLGVASKRLWVLKRRGFALALGGVSIFIPVILLGFFFYDGHIKKTERIAALEAYQSLTLRDKLGEQKITIPISPQFELRYRCYGDENLQGDERFETIRRCRVHKDIDKLRYLSIDTRPDYAPELSHIKISMVRQKCKPKFSTECVQSEVMDKWCAGREALKQSIYCAGESRHRLRFERYKGAGQSEPAVERLYQNAAPDSGLEPVGKDISGAPVLTRCSKIRDERVAQNGGSRLCYLKFTIADDVIAHVTLDDFPPDRLKPEAEAMFKYTHDIWQALRGELGE